MQDALTFIVKTLLELYIITFVLRFILQWVRADFRNPITQFFVRITNPTCDSDTPVNPVNRRSRYGDDNHCIAT